MACLYDLTNEMNPDDAPQVVQYELIIGFPKRFLEGAAHTPL
jgi:hypothetical protein